MSDVGHSRPMHSVSVPINVRCYSNSDIMCSAQRSDAKGQKATWLRSSGLECFAKLCDHRQRYCGAVVPVTRLALVAFGVFSGTGHAPR